mgnify:CR=1 FL=1
MIVEVFLSTALLCFSGTCHNALVGVTTPTGQYEYVKTPIDDPLYGATVAPFAVDNSGGVFAIHQTWLGAPYEQRDVRILGDDRIMTNGCINIPPDVYEQLPQYSELIIHP